MRLPLLLTIIIAAILPPPAVAESASERTDAALAKLDRLLERRSVYINRRQARIDSLSNIYRADSTRLDELVEIGDLYKGFNNDSALAYQKKAASMTGAPLSYRYRWEYASLLPLSGFNELAEDAYESIPADSVPAADLADYYEAGRQMYSYIADSYRSFPMLYARYHHKKLDYQQRLLAVLPSQSVEYKYNKGEYSYLTGHDAEARVLLEEVVDTEPDNSNIRARAAHHLANMARNDGNNDAAVYYLAQSAMADVLSATREVVSLQELGTAVYARGDVNRAYSYLFNALSNAVECGASLRMIDASRSLPLIESTHMSHIRKSRTTLNYIIMVMAILMLLLLASLLVLRHQLYRMSRLQANLRDANVAKEVYISQFLQLCSIYMDKLNQLCKIVTRKLAAGQADELYRMTKSGKFVEEQSAEFYEVFDNAFLHIYPTFVAEVNSLLRPDARIELKPGELLNTDLRILAFMRLGIEESSRIAQILNYSLNTIYAYRNRLKSRAIDKTTFEADIMKIESMS